VTNLADQPPRAIAYVRVSTAREDMISPELQLTAIRDHCARAGYQLVETIQDLDLSGRFWKRRQVDRAIGMIESGDADVLVVWKWSRVSRNRLDWAVAVDRVESAGGKLDSATEPIDTTTSAGRLQRGMLAEFAAFESDRIGDVWREVHARRTKQGLPANGKPRFGYRVVDGIHRPDPDAGPVLAALYRRYIAGESVYALVSWLNSEGYRTAAGYSKQGPSPWTQMTLRRCLDSGFGAGLILVRGEMRRGIHEPVIDEDTWAVYRAARISRRTLRRSERSQYLLSGMMRCQHVLEDGTPCGSSMGGGQFGSSHAPKFRCLASAAERRHPGGYVMMRVAEAAVFDWLGVLAAEVDETSEKVQARSPGRARVKRDADVIARELAVLDEQLVTLTMQVSRRIVPESAYVAARDQIDAERAALSGRHAQAMLSADRMDGGPVAAELLRHWDVLSQEERRAILRTLIRYVEVVPGRPKSVATVVPAWVEEKTP
jgi:DNA invertase Pin-like site-specific DNA recombinase